MADDNFLEFIKTQLQILAQINLYENEFAEIDLILKAVYKKKTDLQTPDIQKNSLFRAVNENAELIAWHRLANAMRHFIVKINEEENKLSIETTFEIGYHPGIIGITDSFAQRALLREKLSLLLEAIHKQYPLIQSELEEKKMEFPV